MPSYKILTTLVAYSYAGAIEAESREQALEKAQNLDTSTLLPPICADCLKYLEDLEVDSVDVEEIDE